MRGRFVSFDVDPSTFSVKDFARRNGTNPPTVIFGSRALDQGAALTTALTLELNGERLRLERAVVAGQQRTRLEAHDCSASDPLETKPTRAATLTNTLGPGFTYRARREERLCFSNSSLTGLDEPENAALVSRTPTTATWRVQAGGRRRTVIGQAAVDGGC